MDGGAVITNEATRVKEIIAHGVMRPRVVIGDPELTLGLPREPYRLDRHGCAVPFAGGLLRSGL